MQFTQMNQSNGHLVPECNFLLVKIMVAVIIGNHYTFKVNRVTLEILVSVKETAFALCLISDPLPV
jgi:hypothetical protein